MNRNTFQKSIADVARGRRRTMSRRASRRHKDTERAGEKKSALYDLRRFVTQSMDDNYNPPG